MPPSLVRSPELGQHTGRLDLLLPQRWVCPVGRLAVIDLDQRVDVQVADHFSDRYTQTIHNGSDDKVAKKGSDRSAVTESILYRVCSVCVGIVRYFGGLDDTSDIALTAEPRKSPVPITPPIFTLRTGQRLHVLAKLSTV